MREVTVVSQDEIRKELKEYLQNKGVKNKYIAQNVGVSDQTISMFLHCKRELSPKRLRSIHLYILDNI